MKLAFSQRPEHRLASTGALETKRSPLTATVSLLLLRNDPDNLREVLTSWVLTSIQENKENEYRKQQENVGYLRKKTISLSLSLSVTNVGISRPKYNVNLPQINRCGQRFSKTPLPDLAVSTILVKRSIYIFTFHIYLIILTFMTEGATCLYNNYLT